VTKSNSIAAAAGIVMAATASWCLATSQVPPASQPAPATEPAAELPDSLGGFEETRQALVADQLIHLAHQLLAGAKLPDQAVAAEQKPAHEQLLCARALLAPALTLRPGDAELTRSLVELDNLLDDRAAAQQELTAYCKLRPDDDAAQRDLILMRVRSLQTVDERAAAFDAVLDDPAAQVLSPALRSRLAFYAAQCWHEMGREPQRFARLRQAAALDPANKPAMQAIYDLVARRPGQPLDLAVALGGVLRADPLDLSARRRLADLLFAQAAYDAAAGQYQVLDILAGGQGAARSFDFYLDWSLSQAASGERRGALATLTQLDALATAMVPLPPATAPATQPAAVPDGLSPGQRRDVESLRLAILRGSGSVSDADADAAAAAMGRLKDACRVAAAAGDKEASAASLLLQLVLGSQPLKPAAVAALGVGAGPDDPRVQLIRGWQLLRQGQPEPSRAIFITLAEHEPFAAYGLAETLKDPGQAQPRKEQLGRVIAMAPAGIAAVLAAADLAALRAPVPATPAGVAAARLVHDLPRAVARPNPQREPLVSLSIATLKDGYLYLEPITAIVRLRNLSDIPLTLGEGGTLPPAAALMVSEHVLDPHFVLTPERLPTLIVDLGRRLRLAPGQTVEVPFRLDLTPFGRRLDEDPLPVNFGATVVFDPLFKPDGTVEAGPAGAMAELVSVNRYVPGMTIDNLRNEHLLRELVDQWEHALDGPAGVRRLQALAIMVRVSARLPRGVEYCRAATQEMSLRLGQAFPRLEPLEQVMLASLLPRKAELPYLCREVHQLADRSDDPLVRMAYMVTQVTAPDAPALISALRSTNPQIHEFAQWLQTSLQAAIPASASGSVAGPADVPAAGAATMAPAATAPATQP
jgi:hypothetical protein